MSGIAERYRYPVHDGKRTVVVDGDKLADRLLGIDRCVKRFDRRLAVFGAFFGNECRVVALNLRGIFEHDGREVACGKGAINIAFESLAAKVRQISAVIDMSMTEDRGLDFFGSKGKVRLRSMDSSRWPWNKPHSSNNFLPLTSMRYMEPVVVRDAPKKWIFIGKRKT